MIRESWKHYTINMLSVCAAVLAAAVGSYSAFAEEGKDAQAQEQKADLAKEFLAIQSLVERMEKTEDHAQAMRLADQAEDDLLPFLLIHRPDDLAAWRLMSRIAVAKKDRGLAMISLFQIKRLSPDFGKDEPGDIDLAERLFKMNSATHDPGIIPEISGVMLDQERSDTYRVTMAYALSIAQGAAVRDNILLDIAAWQAEAGDVKGGEATAAKIQDRDKRDEAYRNIVALQAASGDRKHALSTTAKINSVRYKDEALFDVARAYVKAGDIEGAKTTVSAISTRKDSRMIQIAREIVVSEADGGNVRLALALATTMPHAAHRALWLSDIAASQAKAKDRQGSDKTFARALETTTEIANAVDKSNVLSQIAVAQATAGDKQGADETLALAWTSAAEIADAESKSKALKNIAAWQAEAGNVEGVLSTTAMIADATYKETSLRVIAKSQAKAGDVKAALSTLEGIGNNPGDDLLKASLLEDIAVSQADTGNMESALSITQMIAESGTKQRALRDIATLQAQAGDFQGALSTAGSISASGSFLTGGFLIVSAAYSNIAELQVEAGDVEGALSTLARIPRAPYARARGYAQVASALEKAARERTR